MRRSRAVLLLALLLLASSSVRAQERRGGEAPPSAPRARRFTFGGALGFGFGTVNWVSVTGELGYFATDRLWVGATGRFQYTDDHRYEPTFDSIDYGVGAFTRYFVFDRFFADVEWSWTSYEVRTGSSSSERSGVSSLFLGAGYGQALGASSLLLFEVLYDVTGNANGLYGTPWLIRAGFAAGF